MSNFSWLWLPSNGFLDHPLWRRVFASQMAYRGLVLKILNDKERIAEEYKDAPERSYDDMSPEDAGALANLDRFEREHADYFALKEQSFERIGTILFGCALLEQASHMATLVISHRRLRIVHWNERTASVPRRVQELMLGDLKWNQGSPDIWEKLRTLYTLRNCFLHANGEMDPISIFGQRTLTAAKKMGIIKLGDGFVIGDSGVEIIVGAFLELVEGILESTTRVVEPTS